VRFDGTNKCTYIPDCWFLLLTCYRYAFGETSFYSKHICTGGGIYDNKQNMIQ